MEPIFRKEFTLNDLYCDRFSRLKPSAILHLVQEAAGGHCDLLQLDWQTLAKKRLFWAIIRHRVQVTRLPNQGETITLETWPMPTTRVAYPRSVVAYDGQGKELFRSISLWVLMDLDTRTMILPGKSGIAVSGIVRGNELPSPPSLTPALLSAHAQRRVCYTDLDVNGHMNNARYLDWLADLLPSDFHREHTMKDFTLGYLSEAREGDLLELQWEIQGEGVLRLEIQRLQDEGKKQRIFCADIHY